MAFEVLLSPWITGRFAFGEALLWNLALSTSLSVTLFIALRGLLRAFRRRIPSNQSDWFAAIGTVAFLAFLISLGTLAVLRTRAGWTSPVIPLHRDVATLGATSGMLSIVSYLRFRKETRRIAA